MKVLIVGSGGREHVIAWACARSPKVEKIYCAPGNAGIAQVAELVPLKADQFDELADFAVEHGVDLTVVGMDDPLVGGIVDVFESVDFASSDRGKMQLSWRAARHFPRN